MSGFRGPLLFGITVIGVSGVLALGVTPRRGQIHLATPSDYALATEPIPAAAASPLLWEEIEIEIDAVSPPEPALSDGDAEMEADGDISPDRDNSETPPPADRDHCEQRSP